MTKYTIEPTGIERHLGEDELIVSKTDLKGRITYANDVFCRIADYTVKDLIGAPHSIVRHPEMPRSVFKLLWDTIESGQEIFAYVLNIGRTGDHYWVFAHVTPSFDADGNIIGYHSNRRKPDADKVAKAKDLYDTLLKEEERFESRKEGMESAFAMVAGLLRDKGMGYDEFVFSL